MQDANNLPAPAGWQVHPSTHVDHYFMTDDSESICKRAMRTTGSMKGEPGIFPCSFCVRALDKASR